MNTIPMTLQHALEMKDECGISIPNDGRGIVIEENGRELAKVLCCNFTENSCFVHMVIRDPKVLERNFLANEIFRFTFETMKRTMLLATASSLNEGSLALQRAYGFEEVCRITDAFSNGEDMVISRLTRDEYQKRRAH